MENQTKKMQELFSVKDKVIILTGGKGFLGSHYAEFLTKAGAKIVIWNLPEVDITDEEAVKKALNEVIEKYGRGDVLINNAAMNPKVVDENSKKLFAPIDDYPLELWTNELKVDLTGMFLCTKA